MTTFLDFLSAPTLEREVDQAALTSTTGSGGLVTDFERVWSTVIPASTPGEALSSHASSIFVFPDLSAKKIVRRISVVSLSDFNEQGVYLVDRLVGVGSIDPTSTGDKTINSAALARYTDGYGVEAYLEVQVAPSVSAIVCSLSSYTNQDGTAGRAGPTITFSSATLPVQRFQSLPLQAGDSGIRSVETLNVATASGGTTARLILWLVRRLAILPCYGVVGDWWKEQEMLIPYAKPIRILDGASLGLLYRGGVNGTDRFALNMSVALI